MQINKKLLQKLKALAEKGAPNEREVAAAKIKDLCLRYGISEDETEDEQKKEQAIFGYNGEIQKKLLAQIISTLLDTTEIQQGTATGGKGDDVQTITILLADCTEAQKIEIAFLFDFYNTLFESEVDALMQAFVHKHNLFPPNAFKDLPEDKLTAEQLKKIVGMEYFLDDQSPTKRIESKQ